MDASHKKYMQRAIELAKIGMNSNSGGPFGAIVVKDGRIIAEAYNEVTSSNDPTAHAEVLAIRRACEALGEFQLDNCTIYASCEPCPMCLGAIYWARPQQVYYAGTREDAAGINFDDRFIYKEIDLPPGERSIPFTSLMRSEALNLFKAWDKKEDKVKY